jgi:hypothetical protein
LRPNAVFVDINLPGKGGVLLATQLTMLPQLGSRRWRCTESRRSYLWSSRPLPRGLF